MSTSEERREVAEKLRNLPSDPCADIKKWQADGIFIDANLSDEADYSQIYNAVIGTFPAEYAHHGDYEELHERLADLIEPPEITDDTSDGYHTFGQLYYQRMVLFAVLVQEHKDRAWKTWNHEDGEPCFGGGWFLVTIDTPRGAYGYHYEEKYWNLFDCKELPKAKHWDGYTEENVNRLFSLNCYEVNDDA